MIFSDYERERKKERCFVFHGNYERANIFFSFFVFVILTIVRTKRVLKELLSFNQSLIYMDAQNT